MYIMLKWHLSKSSVCLVSICDNMKIPPFFTCFGSFSP